MKNRTIQCLIGAMMLIASIMVVNTDARLIGSAVAKAGSDQGVVVGNLVQLDGSASTGSGPVLGPFNPVTYQWQLISKPANSTAFLSDPTIVNPTFTVDVLGLYVVELVVTDAVNNSLSNPDQVVINGLLEDGLVGYWRANNNFADASGYGHDGQAVPAGSVTFASGQEGQAFVFDGSSNVQIASNETLKLDLNQTVSAWFKWSGQGDDWQRIVGKGADTDSYARNYGLWINPDGRYYFQFGVTPSSGSPFLTGALYAGTLDTQWHHMMGTYDGQTIKLFLDGVLVKSVPFVVNGSIFKTDDPVTIGGWNNSGDLKFYGLVDEVAIYNKTLNDVSELINAQIFDQPVADAGSDQSVLVGNVVQLDGSGSADPNNDPLSYNWTIVSKPAGSGVALSGATSVNPSFTPDIAGQYVVELVVNDGALDSTPEQVVVNGLLADGLVGYWRANDDFADASGYGHDGQATPAGSVTFSSGQEGQAFDFDGSGTVQIASNETLKLDLNQTVSAWFKWSGQGDDWIRLVGKGADTDTYGRNYGLWIHPDGRHLFQFGVHPLSGSPLFVNATYTQTLDTQWHHMMGTYDGQTIKLYLDGALVASQAFVVNGAIVQTDEPVTIGGWNNPGHEKFHGLIDEVAIYNKALNDVSELISPPNFSPVAQAGSDQSVRVGDVVQLDGSGSSDPDNDPLSYNWTIVSKPAGSSATLSDATVVDPTLTPDIVGQYVVELVVNDGRQDSHVDQVVIDVASIQDGLVGYWRANNDYADVSGYGYQGQPEGSVSFGAGIDGEAFDFDQGRVKIDNASNMQIDQGITISAWFKWSGDNANDEQCLVTIGGSHQLHVRPYNGSYNIFRFRLGYKDNQGQQLSYDYLYATQTPIDTEWHHVMITFDRQIFKWYLDGVVVKTEPGYAGWGPLGQYNDTVTIGAIASDSYYFRGAIDEVAIYNRALTGVSELITTQNVNISPVAHAGADQEVSAGSTVQLDGSGSSDANSDPLTYSWQLVSQPFGSSVSLSGANSVNPTFVPDAGGKYVVELVVNDGTTNSASDQVVITSTLQDGLVGYWRANNNFVDGSGYENHAQSVPANAVDFDLGIEGQAFAFDGQSNVQIASTAALKLGANQTVSAWFKWSGVGTDWQRIVGKGEDVYPAGEERNYGLWIHPSGLYMFQFSGYNNGFPLRPWSAAATHNPNVALDTKWHHLMGTYDGQTIKLYLDGVLVESVPFTFTGAIDQPDFPVTIGGWNTSAHQKFHGQVDEVAIYNRTLSGTSELINSDLLIRPLADAGVDQISSINTLVQLDGGGSSDPENNPLTYNWTLISTPAGSNASLSSTTSVTTTFTPDVQGLYVAQLVVNNGTQNSTPDEVTIDVKLQEGLVAYWRANNSFNDETLNAHHGQSVPVGAVTFDVGQEGQAFVFDGSNQVQIDNAQDLILGINQTVSAWFKWSGQGTGWQRVVAKGEPGDLDGNSPRRNYGLWMHTDGRYRFEVMGTFDGIKTEFVTNVTPDTEWHHIMGSYDGQTLKLYLDGNLVSETAKTSSSMSGTTEPVSIGGWPNSNADQFYGAIDEVAIYNRTVSVSELIYTPDNYRPLANIGVNQTVLDVGETFHFDGSGSSDHENTSLTYNWTLVSKPDGSQSALIDATTATPTLVSDVIGQYVVRLVVNDGTAEGVPYQITVSAKLQDGLVGYWKASDNYTDASGYGHHGQPAGFVGFEPGQDGQAFVFDGSSNVKVASTDVLHLGYKQTLSAWFKWDGEGTNWQRIIGKSVSYNSSDHRIYGLWIHPSGRYLYQLMGNRFGYAWPATAEYVTHAPPDNEWHHLMGTYDEETIKLYLDGQLVSEVASVPDGAFLIESDEPFTIGGWDKANFEKFHGSVDEVAIYNRPLNDASEAINAPTNFRPVAKAGADQVLTASAPVQLDGSGSADADNDPITYRWRIVSKPFDSAASLSGETSATPSFVPDTGGLYVVELVVNDGTQDSAPDQIVITLDIPGLVGYWRANNDYLDSSGYGRHGQSVPSGAVTFDLGTEGQAFVFDGQRNVRIPSTDALKLGVHQTVSAWFKWSGQGNDWQRIVGKGEDNYPTLYRNYGLWIHPNGHYMFQFSGRPGFGAAWVGQAEHVATEPVDTQWHHLMGTYDGQTIKLYLDGNLVKSVAFTVNGFISQTDDPVTIGGWNLNNLHQKFHGLIDEVAIYNKALDNPSELVSSQLLVRPIADAGTDRTARVNTTVQLDGSGSSDPENGSLTYNWQLVSTPAGSNVALSGATTVNPTFIPDKIGQYVFELVVNNGSQDSNSDQVTIDAKLQEGLVAYWRANNNFFDETQNGHEGQSVPSGGVTFDAGYEGQAFVFDGQSNVQIPSTEDLKLDVNQTVSAWFKWSGEGSGWQRIVGKGEAGDLDGNDPYTTPTRNYGLWMHTDGRYRFEVMGDRPATAEFAINTIPDTQWHHMMGTYDGQTMKLYLDGALVRSVGVNSSYTYKTDDPVTIGGWNASVHQKFHGSVDDVAIYNRALGDVSELINVPDNFAPTARLVVDQDVLNVGETFHFDGSGSSDPENASLTYNWTLVSKPDDSQSALVDATTATPTLVSDVIGQYVVRLVVNDGTVDSVPYQITVNARLQDGLVGYWRASDDYTDASGYGHHGQPAGSVGFEPGQDGQAFVFDGSSNVKVASNEILHLGYKQTLSAWFKWDGDGTNWQRIIGKSVSYNSSDHRIYGLWIHPSGRYLYQLMGNRFGYAWPATAEYVTHTPPDTEWHHLMGTYDGQTIKLYLDGQLVSEVASVPDGAFLIQSDEPFTIGGWDKTNFEKFHGSVDEVAIYNKTLNSVSELINAPTNFRPVAKAGADQVLLASAPVQLDGSGSADADNDPLTYRWRIVSKPFDSAASLSGETSATPSFVPDTGGLYVVELVVNDGTTDSAPDQVVVKLDIPGLVGYWRANNDYLDSSGYGRHGQSVPSGAVTFDLGTEGQAFVFDGQSNVQIPSVDGLKLGVHQTVSAWFKWSGVGNDWQRIVGKGEDTYPIGAQRNYGLWIHPGGHYMFQFSGHSGGFPSVSWQAGADYVTTEPMDTQWHHLMGTYDGQTIKLYLDGAMVKSVPVTVTGTIDQTDHAVTIGGWNTLAHQKFNGLIDEVAIYNKALNAVSELAGFDPSLFNEAPVAVDDAVTTDEDAVAILSTLLNNDSDADGDALSIISFTDPENGTLVVSELGLTYTPNSNFNGDDSFTYTISDGRDGTATATVAITVTPVNDAPVATDDVATTDEDVAVTIAVLANDSDVEEDALAVTIAAQGNKGTAVVNEDGTVTYTPNAHVHGEDSFSYSVSDGHEGTATARVAVTIHSVNDAPVAVDDAVTTDEDVVVTLTLLSNDTDVDEDALVIVSVTSPTHGAVAITEAGVTYTPNPNFNGSDTFDYVISDGHEGTDTGTVTVTITPVNDAPVLTAVGDQSVDEDNALTLTINASDIDGDDLTINATGTEFVTATIEGSTLTLTPVANYNGGASITITVDDGNDGIANDAFTLTVNPVNDAPVAADDAATTDEDTAVIIAVLTNDTDVDEDALSVTIATQGTIGNAVVNADGTVTYTPHPNANGEDSFTYTVLDGNDGTDVGTVGVTITPVNDAPVIVVNNGLTVDEGTVASVSSLLLKATDVDNAPVALAYALKTAPVNGTLSLGVNALSTGSIFTQADINNGEVYYQHDGSETLSDSFEFDLSDGDISLLNKGFSIVVNPVNDAPVSQAGLDQTVIEGDLVYLDGSGSSDIEGNALTYIWTVNRPDGQAIILSDAQPVFSADVAGQYVIQLVVNDGELNSGVDDVLVTAQTAGEAAQELITQVTDLLSSGSLPAGTANSMTSTLQSAIAAADDGQLNTADNQLNAFINKVSAQSGKKLTEEQASQLIASANTIRANLQKRAGDTAGGNGKGKKSAKPVATKLVFSKDAGQALTFGAHNYPNPFNPETIIMYSLPEDTEVRLVIYNVLGQQVRELVNAYQSPGQYGVRWNGQNDLGRQVSSGVYFYRLVAGSNVVMNKMLLMK